MKASELATTALSYLACSAIVNLLIKSLAYDKPSIALAVAAVVGTQVAAWQYCRRVRGPAAFPAKIQAGVMLAAVCVCQSLVFQWLWHWMDRPLITIIVGAAGSFACPLFLFERLRKRLPAARGDN